MELTPAPLMSMAARQSTMPGENQLKGEAQVEGVDSCCRAEPCHLPTGRRGTMNWQKG